MSKELKINEPLNAVRVTETELKQLITTHALYIDPMGKKSSGPAGLALQINLRVKAAYGDSREDFDEEKLISLAGLQRALMRIIRDGEQAKRSRAEIKAELYQKIEDYGKAVNQIGLMKR